MDPLARRQLSYDQLNTKGKTRSFFLNLTLNLTLTLKQHITIYISNMNAKLMEMIVTRGFISVYRCLSFKIRPHCVSWCWNKGIFNTQGKPQSRSILWTYISVNIKSKRYLLVTGVCHVVLLPSTFMLSTRRLTSPRSALPSVHI